MADQTYKIAKAAELLDCHPIKVYRLIWSGRLGAIDLNNDGKPVKPGQKVKRPSWRVPQSAIDKLSAEVIAVPQPPHMRAVSRG